MNSIYQDIVKRAASGEKMLAVLVDPEKCTEALIERYCDEIKRGKPDYIFIGGSQLSFSSEDVVNRLKCCNVPLVLFPGNLSQLCNNADALLLLSLISGRNAEYLIGQQVKAASYIKQSGMESISTGYIVIDGGLTSAVSRVSGTAPMESNNVSLIVDTAIAGELLGMKLIYLEAGSGAKNRVKAEVIREVRRNITIPLIVGGGIHTAPQLIDALDAGADLIVVGNYFEQHPEDITLLSETVHSFKQ